MVAWHGSFCTPWAESVSTTLGAIQLHDQTASTLFDQRVYSGIRARGIPVDMKSSDHYPCLRRRLEDDVENPDMPFYFVQLPRVQG